VARPREIFFTRSNAVAPILQLNLGFCRSYPRIESPNYWGKRHCNICCWAIYMGRSRARV